MFERATEVPHQRCSRTAPCESPLLGDKVKEKYSKLVPSCSPSSSSKWLFRTFGRRAAEDLRRRACDVIHVQHCSQYLPIIRVLNPRAKIVEWFSQNRPAILETRLRYVDLVTTVSDYITEKTCRQFPMIAGRGVQPRTKLRCSVAAGKADPLCRRSFVPQRPSRPVGRLLDRGEGIFGSPLGRGRCAIKLSSGRKLRFARPGTDRERISVLYL
jgi:hypothetical protein